MPAFNLTFHYDGKHDPRVVGQQTVTAETLDQAVRMVARARGIAWMHIRQVDGVAVDRDFFCVPPPY